MDIEDKTIKIKKSNENQSNHPRQAPPKLPKRPPPITTTTVKKQDKNETKKP